MNVVNFNDFINEQLEIAKKEKQERLRKEQIDSAQEEFEDVTKLKNKVLALKDFIETIYPRIIEELIIHYREKLLNEDVEKFFIDKWFSYSKFGIAPIYDSIIEDFLADYNIGRTDEDGFGFRINGTLKQLIDAYYTELQFLPDKIKQVEDIIEGHGYGGPKR